MILPAISVRPPWSHFISRLPVTYAKETENRSRRLSYRGPLLIHASQGCTRADYESALTFVESFTDVPPALFPRFEALERGGIVGAVRLVGLTNPDGVGGPWHVPGCWGYQLRDHTPLPFRPLKGALGLFRVELTPTEEATLRAAGLLPIAA